ncbi:MAG: host-nuclease inhibitor Gam family protein [Planctomycetaceae bacterium]|nr:host-nuclease inhibitor Gam family protein [Planctomycetaceae bacterium]
MTQRPNALGVDSAITTLDDVNAALHELGWLTQQSAAVDARTKSAIEQLKQTACEKLAVDIGGQRITFADRAAALRTRLEDWCREHLASHLPEGAKTLELSHGRIGTRKAPAAVAFATGETEKSVMSSIDKRAKLQSLLSKLLLTVLGSLTLGRLIRLKPELDKVSIKKAWAEGKRQQQTLKSVGLSVETERDEFVIEPAAVEVTAPVG